ncbi:MAG: division plane positioning ATPase MipZ [Paratractidigestivibacter faecalis]|uniref:AAA family ATPase n=1 Tax=Paratractidigestivibacter faecalis TaxID=2292441 RepID=UPI002A91252A|nr:division plane positioning ATPase MipZ [Paratractidigestivibacter faecalis]MDY6014597.1 division plane positioning ATPase MipZ [Paratractidigestivibacter faecalis]
MSDACEWVGYCIDEGIGDLQRAAGTLGALDELSMAHDADELRRMVRDSEVGALGVIVGMTSDGVSDVNLAAAIARDGRARVVALVRRGASGSLRSRARNAGIDLVLDPTGEECREAEPPSALPSSPLSADPRSLLGPLESRAPVIALCSGRGGAGKTTIVAGMACAAARWGMRVAAVDLDLSCGNLHSCFGMRPVVDPTSLVGEWGSEGRALFSASPGVSVTAPCGRPEMSELVMPQAASLVARAAEGTDLVLVDTSTTFTDAVAQAAQMCDRLVLVSDGAPGSMAAIARMGGLAVRLGVARTRISRLENRANPHAKTDFSLLRAEVGLEAARVFRVFDGGAEVSELIAAGQVASLMGLTGPFSRSVSAVTAQLLLELGRLPDDEEARRLSEEQTTKRWPFSLGLRREAR